MSAQSTPPITIEESRGTLPSRVSESNDIHCESQRLKLAGCVHVLFLVDQLTNLGGGERALMQMVRGLSARFRCSVITFRSNLHPDVSHLLPVPVSVIPLVRTYDMSAFRAALALRRFIRDNCVDIVHTFFETSDLWGGAVAKLSGAKVLISSRRDMALLRSTKHDLAYRVMGRMSDRILTVSDAVRQLVISKDGLDGRRVTTLHTGVCPVERSSDQVLRKLRSNIGIPPGAPIVLKVAHILPWKGHKDFLDTAARVRVNHPDVHFVVAGAPSDSGLAADLLTHRSSLGLDDSFHYIGGVAKTGPLYQTASVLCLLSTTEGLPNAVLEAMSAGCPVVATDVGGTSEAVIDGVTGFLVKPGDSQTAAARVSQLLNSSQFASQMSRAAVRRVEEHFSVDAMIAALEGIYDTTLREKSY